jgi:alkanesulfonate monooxygenase SsuD/methylene tetrahydromethanopterin reductase-like flavin-dependent oxidoreductase (luciferase family)
VYRSQLDLRVDSEALGYDHAWLTEHHFVDDGYSPSLLPIAGAVAALTTRIRIGTFLILLPLHNPVRIAEDTATIDLISNGRFDLGVGLGYRREEFSDQGIPHEERGARLREGIEIIQRLLSGEEVTIDGKFSKLNKIKIVPPALQKPHPPIWLGAIAPKAIERAAKMGFHFQVVGPPSCVEQYDGYLKAAGRDPQDFNTAQLRWIHVAPSRAQAWENSARALHHTASCYAKWFGEANDKPGDDQALVGMPSVDDMIAKQEFDMFGEPAIVGTPEDAKEMIADYIGRGRVTQLVCGMAFAGLEPHHIRSSMEIFAKDVIPAFRK